MGPTRRWGASQLAPGGYEIARVDDFDMLGHVKIVNPCYFIATRGNFTAWATWPRSLARPWNLAKSGSRAKTGTEFWNRLSDLWKPNRNQLIVILSLIVGRSKLVQRTSEDDLSLPLMGWDPFSTKLLFIYWLKTKINLMQNIEINIHGFRFIEIETGYVAKPNCD